MHLTLFVPELLWPEPDDHPAIATNTCPALETLLARSRFTRSEAQPPESALSALFGHDATAPLGPLRRLGEDDAPDIADERWLCTDPVHLKFHDERLILADSTRFDITLDEAQQLVAALNAELQELGRFYAASAERWYLRLAEDTALPPLDAPPLSGVAGRHVGQLLPDILTERDWRRHVNAIQTVLHAHPINRQRDHAGRMTLNSLWLWGDGHLPPKRQAPFDTIHGDLVLARGLARIAERRVHPRPTDAAALLASAADATPLIVLDDLLAPARYDDGDAWLAALARLETGWFAPLRAALAAGKLKQLSIVATTTHGLLCWDCRRNDRWKFWRKAEPLAAISTLAARLAASSKETE